MDLPQDPTETIGQYRSLWLDVSKNRIPDDRPESKELVGNPTRERGEDEKDQKSKPPS
jgi:hypothetical protein